MSRIPVLVTGVGGGGQGEQLVKALRMAQTPYFIIGTDMTACSASLGDVDQAHILPPALHPEYLESLLKLCSDYGVRALFHGSEPELKVMARHRNTIEGQGIFLPIQPDHVLETCMDKVCTFDILRRAGVAVPRFQAVRELQDLDAVDFLPAVLKPSVGSGGSAHTYIAQNRQELNFFGQHLLGFCQEFVAQEYVGTPDCEYTVGILSDLNGEFVNSIALRRYILSSLGNRVKLPNRTGREEFGPLLALSSGISQGEIGRFPEVCAQCEEIARIVGSRGPMNVQCRFSSGRVHVFEINPRFSGTTSLRAMVGFNEPDLLIRRHLLGQQVEPRFPYREGVIMRKLAEVLLEKAQFPGGTHA